MRVMKIFAACIAMVLAIGVARASEPVSALAALDALPDKFHMGVLKLTADNANPNPKTWYFTAQEGGPDTPIHSIVVEDGQVIRNRLSLGIREIFSNPSAIDFAKVGVDSTAAYAIAAAYASANNQTLGGVSFALQQKGGAAMPIWSIWCYSQSGSYLGRMDLLASDGTVITNDAFPVSP